MNYMIWLMDKKCNSRLVGREIATELDARKAVREVSGPGTYAYAFKWKNGVGQFALGSLDGDEPSEVNLLPIIRKMYLAEREERK